jgi:hypothetical protein
MGKMMNLVDQPPISLTVERFKQRSASFASARNNSVEISVNAPQDDFHQRLTFDLGMCLTHLICVGDSAIAFLPGKGSADSS